MFKFEPFLLSLGATPGFLAVPIPTLTATAAVSYTTALHRMLTLLPRRLATISPRLVLSNSRSFAMSTSEVGPVQQAIQDKVCSPLTNNLQQSQTRRSRTSAGREVARIAGRLDGTGTAAGRVCETGDRSVHRCQPLQADPTLLIDNCRPFSRFPRDLKRLSPPPASCPYASERRWKWRDALYRAGRQ